LFGWPTQGRQHRRDRVGTHLTPQASYRGRWSRGPCVVTAKCSATAAAIS
jgi:hypothetical protein